MHGSSKCAVRVWRGGSLGHCVIMPRAGSVRCCAYHDCHKRSDKKRLFGHVYPVVPAVIQRQPQLFKAEHDGLLCNQHGCKLAAVSGGRVEADAVDTLGSDEVDINSPPTPLPLSSSPSPSLVQLASAALQPGTLPQGNHDDRTLRPLPLDTTSTSEAADDGCLDLLFRCASSSVRFLSPSSLFSSPPP